MKPLANVKVLDLGKVIAGPICGQWLGDLGADVIKVEPVTTGDDTRAWPPHVSGESAMFLAFNRNKRSLAVDMKTAEGRDIVHRLARQSDIVIQGFGAGAAKRLGVDYETLSSLKPDLIYCEISGYGRSGPLGDLPGYDVMIQAFSGMISTMGYEDGPLVRVSFSPIDQSTGMHALSGIMAALIERGRTGKGAFIEVSLFETAMGLLGYMASNFWQGGERPRKMGSGHSTLCPYQAFEAADGALLLAVGNDGQWRRFCDIAGLSDLKDDERFATNKARVANFDATVERVAAKMTSDTVANWVERLAQVKVPCSPVNTLMDALAHRQVDTRQIAVRQDHPKLGEIRTIAYPVTFNGQKTEARVPPPLLGQHTFEILRGLGFDADSLSDLAARRIVAGPVPRHA
ncbi:CoA transferase [Bradyrhizobium sp. 31Argb]|uniref:CaiB/BaiF CoA transferase family protein n=1 Tax=Bradyrhizobium sp. 31Argb TaxID=3141247 RepID=UPI00374A4633